MTKATLFLYLNLTFLLFTTSLNFSTCNPLWTRRRRRQFPHFRPRLPFPTTPPPPPQLPSPPPPPPPPPPPTTSKQISTILIFGDSTVDTGNNNFLSTVFKSNFPPYGQDYPGHVATGRFSNGKLVPDFLASMLGIKDSVPPFLDPALSPGELMSGVSFASAGSGYDELTTVFTNVVPVLKQVDMFRRYIERVKVVVGEETRALEVVNAALVMVTAGTNDMTFNFYDIPSRRKDFNVSGYHHFLLNNLQIFLKELYSLGARRMIVTGLPPIGCLPIQRASRNSQKSCVKRQNSDSQSYNKNLKNLLPTLQAQLPRSNLIYGDIYRPFVDMIKSPRKYGFAEVKKGCCGTGQSTETSSMLCNTRTPKCVNASQYFFWDSIHPSQKTYELASRRIHRELLPQLFDSEIVLD
ncbi:GDSL esterase/lipase At1g06990 [Linum perenne]